VHHPILSWNLLGGLIHFRARLSTVQTYPTRPELLLRVRSPEFLSPRTIWKIFFLLPSSLWAPNLMQIAMKRLQKKFYQLPSTNRASDLPFLFPLPSTQHRSLGDHRLGGALRRRHAVMFFGPKNMIIYVKRRLYIVVCLSSYTSSFELPIYCE
jgi:hypothetical protein